MARSTTRATRPPDPSDDDAGASAGAHPDTTSTTALPPESSPPELIVVGHLDAGLHITAAGAESTTGWDLGDVAAIAADPAITIEPLFGSSEDRVRASVPGTATVGTGPTAADSAAPDGPDLLTTADATAALPSGVTMATFYRVATATTEVADLEALA